MKFSAGLLLRCNDRYLLAHHTERDTWEAPGGTVEDNESNKYAALREFAEETGIKIDDADRVDTSYHDGVVFATHLADYCPTSDEIQLNHELDQIGWFDADDLPDGTHPEVERLIGELYEMPTEYEVAQAISKGVLPSPQRFGPMWLFAMRLTGTGVSYRPDLAEYVFRPKEWYLTNSFLERCAGVPAIFMHPEDGQLLDSDEYKQRTIGSVIFAYIDGDEVWCIARIYDDDAAQLMTQTHRSTSPSVAFGNRGGENAAVDLGNGEHVLIEGEPVLIDHLAICEAGVWDKGSDNPGVLIGFRE